MSFQPIENYGVIGNMRSIALVGMNGSVDFLCYPDFDSPTVFAALPDDNRGGRFQIEPQLTNARIRQLYLPDTNILLTRFLAEEGVAELTDYMPIERDVEQPNEIIRTISVIRGNVHFKTRCQPRFNYETSPHRALQRLSFSVDCVRRESNRTCAGNLEKAQLLFEKLLGYANHLGLYSEELGGNGQHLGNFPQAFAHLALISAATYLDRALSGTGEVVWR